MIMNQWSIVFELNYVCQTSVLGLGLGVDFTFAWDNNNNNNNNNDNNHDNDNDKNNPHLNFLEVNNTRR